MKRNVFLSKSIWFLASVATIGLIPVLQASACVECGCRKEGAECVDTHSDAHHSHSHSDESHSHNAPTLTGVSNLSAAANGSSAPLRIVVVADTQGNGSNQGVDGIVPQLMSDIALRNPGPVLFPGDLVSVGTASTLSDWNNVTSQFGSNRYMVPGNHDLPGRPATHGNWQTEFSWLPDSQRVPNVTTANPRDMVQGIDKMDYYVDLAPNVRLISVTSDRDLLPGESATHTGGYEVLGGEPKALDWFQSVMALQSTQDMEHVFVMTHHPITTQMSQVNSSIPLTEGTSTDWWKSIAGTNQSHAGGSAEALFAGHVHGYYPNRPDPKSDTAEVIVGTGGGSTDFGGVPSRRVHGFTEVVIENGNVSTTFYGDSNGATGGWSFTEVLDTFTISESGSVPRGEQAFYRFESLAPAGDSSLSPLSKGHVLNFNQGAAVVNDATRGDVLSLNGNAFADSKSIGDHNFQILGDLRIQLWAKADGQLGNETTDNVLAAFGDADGAPRFTWLDTHNDEIANFAYILSYTADGHLQATWEYHDDPDADARAETIVLTSTDAVDNPQEWHQIEFLRDAETNKVRFMVDGEALGFDVSFSNLPTGAGAGSLYLGALPNTADGNNGGIATFSGRLDDVIISNELVTIDGPVLGDLNFDSVIDTADWLVFLQGHGGDFNGMTSSEAYALGDLDADYDNDIDDFVLFKEIFETANGVGSLQAVPEPSTILLSLFFVLLPAIVHSN